MKIYALREVKTGRYLSISASSNEGEEFCNDCTVYLETNDTSCYWTTTDLVLAKYVCCVSTGWYNSCIETPNHNYKLEDLEIVELGSEEVIEGEDLPYNYDIISMNGGYIVPWKIEDSKKSRSYSYYDYQKYLENKGK